MGRYFMGEVKVGDMSEKSTLANRLRVQNAGNMRIEID
jgi:hypothetical protein